MRTFLDFDTREFLNVMALAFEEDEFGSSDKWVGSQNTDFWSEHIFNVVRAISKSCVMQETSEAESGGYITSDNGGRDRVHPQADRHAVYVPG